MFGEGEPGCSVELLALKQERPRQTDRMPGITRSIDDSSTSCGAFLKRHAPSPNTHTPSGTSGKVLTSKDINPHIFTPPKITQGSGW